LEEENIAFEGGITPEQGLEKLRADRGNPETVGGFFYTLMAEAPEEMREHLEKQAGQIIAVGHNIGLAVAAAEKSPKLKAAFQRRLKELAVRLNSESRIPEAYQDEE